MGLVVAGGERKSFEPISSGVHMCVCSGLIDLGTQVGEYQGNQTIAKKVIIQWDFTDETYEDQDGNEKIRQMSKEYTASIFSEKAKLRQDLTAWRGKEFSADELKKFDLSSVLGAGCQIQIIHVEKGDKKYANIKSIMSLPKGLKLDKPSEYLVFDLDDKDTWSNWSKIPQWIQDKIMSAVEYEKSGLADFVANDGEIVEAPEAPVKAEVKKPTPKAAPKAEETDDVDAVFGE